MDANPTIAPVAPVAAAAAGVGEQGPDITPRSTTAASDAAASSAEPALAEVAATTAAAVDALDSDAAETDTNDDASETSAAAAADATTRAGTGVALRPTPAAQAAAKAAATPVVSAPLRTTPVAAALPPRRKWCSIYNLFVAAVVLFFVSLSALAWWLRPALIKAWSGQRSPDHPSEAHFSADGIASGPKLPFPSVADEPTIFLSVVVPAYNEEERMRKGLDEMISFLQSKPDNFTWEIVIVNDGSRDKTAEITLNEYVAVHGSEHVRLLDLFKNGGKGGAVRKGVLRTRGEYVLMADADGATRFSDFDALLQSAQRIQVAGASGPLSFAIGSRAQQWAERKIARSALRRFLSWGFHGVINLLLGGSSIEDTQCGFKLFSRAAARELFSVLHIERWAFDVELVYIAARRRIPMVEVPVVWEEIAGSKLDPASASIQMARDIIVIRIAYMLGWWEL